MEITWTSKSISDLNSIVTYLKKNKMGEILEHFANYFINKHQKFTNIEKFSMGFKSSDNIDTSIISEGEYKLAFISELSSLYHAMFSLKKKKIKKIEKKPFQSVYDSFSYMIKYCIIKNYRLNSHKLHYEEYYLADIIKDCLLPKEKTINKDDYKIQKTFFAYHLVKELMDLTKNREDYVCMLSSLMSESQDLDLSILSKTQRRNLLEILQTKRTLYLRFLLVLAREILNGGKKHLDHEWLISRVTFSNHEQFLKVLTSPLIETVIFITLNRIVQKS